MTSTHTNLAASFLVALSVLSAEDASAAPTDLVQGNLQAKPIGVLVAPGKPDPSKPEFVMQFSNMYEGDYTYKGTDLRGNQVEGRAVDCNSLVNVRNQDGSLVRDSKGKPQYFMTLKFLLESADIRDGSNFDTYANSNQGKTALVERGILERYENHINLAHHPKGETDAIAAICQQLYPSSE